MGCRSRSSRARPSRWWAIRVRGSRRARTCCCDSGTWIGLGLGRGSDVRELTQRDLRAAMAVVPQDVYLFHASASRRTSGSGDGGRREGVEHAARPRAGPPVHRAAPRRWDTVLGERGASLSGGQRQRLAIARALLKDAPILVMDEAVANLDAESETALREAIAEVARDRTTLLIAHRPSTIHTADRVVVLDQGGSSSREPSTRSCPRRPPRTAARGLRSSKRPSIGEQRNPKPFVTPEEHTTRDCGRSESFMQAVESRVDRRRGRAAERQRQLDRVVTEQVAEGEADQRDAPTRDLGQGVGEQDPAGLQQRHRVRRRLGQCVRPRRS